MSDTLGRPDGFIPHSYIDENGVSYGVPKDSDGHPLFSDAHSRLNIAQGNVVGTSVIHKFGQAPDFDTSDGSVIIWDGANDAGANLMNYTYSTTADIDSLSSSDNGDTQLIEVQGLDDNWDLVIQSITLTGQTRVALTTNLIRVFRLKNLGNTNNAGDIYCFKNVATTSGVPNTIANTRAIMRAGNNQTLMSVFTIPNGKTGYLDNIYMGTAGASKSAEYEMDLYSRPFGGVFQLKHRRAVADGGTTDINHIYIIPEKINAKTDIHIASKILTVGVAGATIISGFDLIIIDD